jgi:predicted dehydrogenase
MIRAGVLSAGSWSESSHLPALRDHPYVDLLVVARPNGEQVRRVARTFGIPGWETDWRRALAAGLDAAVVSSPPVAHEEQVLAALEASAHVLCEKPFGITSASVWRMVDAARAADRHLLVGFGWTATPVFRLAHDLVARGGLGDLEHVMMHLAVNTRELLGGARGGGWDRAAESEAATYVDPNVSGGGAAAVSMSHQLGMLLWLVQRPIARIYARTFPAGEQVDLHDAAVVEFVGGASGALSCASTHPHLPRPQWHVALYGSRGQLWIDSLRDHLRLVRSDGTVWEPELEQGAGDYDKEAPTKALIDAAAGGAPNDGYASALGARVVEVTEALYRSAAEGRMVTVERRVA